MEPELTIQLVTQLEHLLNDTTNHISFTKCEIAGAGFKSVSYKLSNKNGKKLFKITESEPKMTDKDFCLLGMMDYKLIVYASPNLKFYETGKNKGTLAPAAVLMKRLFQSCAAKMQFMQYQTTNNIIIRDFRQR